MEEDARLKVLKEIEWEVGRVHQDFEQRQAQADLVRLEDRDEAWREARERRYLQYLEDMKALASRYAALRMERDSEPHN